VGPTEFVAVVKTVAVKTRFTPASVVVLFEVSVSVEGNKVGWTACGTEVLAFQFASPAYFATMLCCTFPERVLLMVATLVATGAVAISVPLS